MLDKIVAFREHVKRAASNPDFIHHLWYVKWHLEVVEKFASELCEHYPDANKEMVEVMVWLHDYGKIVDYNREYEATQTEGAKALFGLGFPHQFVETVLKGIELLDRKMEVDLHQAPIEVQIVSSADGCSHMIGPFMYLWWYENAQQPFEQLMAGNRRKVENDWNRKIVLPEARQAVEARYELIIEQMGSLPARYV